MDELCKSSHIQLLEKAKYFKMFIFMAEVEEGNIGVYEDCQPLVARGNFGSRGFS